MHGVFDRIPVMITVILFVRILMAYTYIESCKVVVWNDDISRHERTEAVITARVCRAGYGRQRSTVEVAFSKHVTCLVWRYFLHVVRPLASQLYCRLECLRPCLSVPHIMQCLYSVLSYTSSHVLYSTQPLTLFTQISCVFQLCYIIYNFYDDDDIFIMLIS